ncbi:TetR/AcrR family transcriptional regulator [Helicovermis profundi]|uniref:TetR/AcrR family transcriptional regulator n=1 Tax=Helicovermis profundi TaxID=3065157 RepID=A0AAU9EFK6_9FIRM|nr:TetR/AcrR family transcriptional regulator [Clostridia bacterium S502]
MTEKKQVIIETASRLFHEHGFNNVGIKKILDELGIPKGSFYHFFKSKDDLIYHIMDLYISDTQHLIVNSPNTVEGIKKFFHTYFERLISMGLRGGCPVGNLILELSDEKEIYRLKLLEWNNLIENWIIEVLKNENIDDYLSKAKIILSLFEGVTMFSKLTKDEEYFKVFENYIFCNLLKN